MNITVLGHVCIDQNTSEGVVYTGAGGATMFMAQIFSHFPAVQSHIIAPYGPDFDAYAQTVSLYPTKPGEQKTLIYENVSFGNTRRQTAHNRAFANPPRIDEGMKELLVETDVFLLHP
jgi:hypothetical protein